MRVYISLTPEPLHAHREAAFEVAHDLSFDPLMPSPDPAEIGDVEASIRDLATADLLLAIVGWQRDPVPGPELGGDGLRSYTQWGVMEAFRRRQRVLVLMTDQGWPLEAEEKEAEARAVIRDFRGELDRLAVFFNYEVPGAGRELGLSMFRSKLRQALLRCRQGSSRGDSSGVHGAHTRSLKIPSWAPAELPENPYPLLLPYTHPSLLAGRDHELARLRQLLREPIPILGMPAVSGSGKSSLLAAGLVPSLRERGLPVAFERHPAEPGLVSRLVGDLLSGADDVAELADDDCRSFVERLQAAHELAAGPPLLVLDQFEDLLRYSQRRRIRALAGILLAASVQRQPGLEGPLCRWILAYRQEFHGEVVTWLADVLRDARAEGLAGIDNLPLDLSTSDRFHSWVLPPLGGFRESGDRLAAATSAFQAAIEQPLELRAGDGSLKYPWRFAGDGARRLARAFGEARVARPGAPLVPELQVVLAHLLERAETPEVWDLETSSGDDSEISVEVPENPGGLIDEALEDHLRRALDGAFPVHRRTEESALARTRALLVLRELVDANGRRDEAQPASALARAIGHDGAEVLERLSTPQTRLVVQEKKPDGWYYALSHDRMAEVLAQVFDEEVRQSRLAVDTELLGLRRFVALNTELFRSGEILQATRISRRYFKRIRANADALLWGEDRRRWWAACVERRSRDRRRRSLVSLGAGLVLVAVAFGVQLWARQRAEIQARREQITDGKPAAALTSLLRMAANPTVSRAEVWDLLSQRESMVDLFEQGVGLSAEAQRAPRVLDAVEFLLPMVEESADPFLVIGTMTWALDYFPGRDDAHAEAAGRLRERLLESLRRRRPAPPIRGDDWIDVAGGSFLMGAADDEEGDQFILDRERPRHAVTVSPFRILKHEVTNAEYRRLVPDHPGDDEKPVTRVSWFAAATYAAWLGGRLPTEAEWEYAARTPCPPGAPSSSPCCAHPYCTSTGEAATIDQVVWYLGNSRALPRVMQRPPNPWGIYDMVGTVLEWTADCYAAYTPEPQIDPRGPPICTSRAVRGGSYHHNKHWTRAGYRIGFLPSFENAFVGFRVVREISPGAAEVPSSSTGVAAPASSAILAE